jgi:hypothetical protein
MFNYQLETIVYGKEIERKIETDGGQTDKKKYRRKATEEDNPRRQKNKSANIYFISEIADNCRRMKGWVKTGRIARIGMRRKDDK